MQQKKFDKIPVYFHTSQMEFRPKYEWALGLRIKHPETTKRAENIYRTLKKEKEHFTIIAPPEIPLRAIQEIHDEQLITLYNAALSLPDDHAFYPSVFPQRKKAQADASNLFHAGLFCFDSGTPLNNKTWPAAAWSAGCAYYATCAVEQGQAKMSYALSRPPGHHASKDTYGGYCYFNNAAIAAKRLRRKGRVAIIDIDFHHGNGTQDIFYQDDKVLFVSLHGDPKAYFPFFCGHATETGQGAGLGFNINIIVPAEADFKQYAYQLKTQALSAIQHFRPEFLIISAGFDTYKLDPIGNFKLETKDFYTMGEMLGQLQLPTVVIQEGGYYTPDLGNNVAHFLAGLQSTIGN